MASKKKQPPKKAFNRKWLWVLIPVLVIALAAGGFGIYRLATYNTVNHTGWITGSERAEYNSALTQQARATGRIAKNEILIMDNLHRTLGADAEVEFTVYRLPDGANEADYLHLDGARLPDDFPLEALGNGTCKLLGDRLNAIYNMTINYLR